MRNPNAPVPTLSTLERLLNEMDEYYANFKKLRQRQRLLQPASEAYQDLLADLSVELDWLKMKAEAAAGIIDDYQGSLPDDD